MRTFGYLSFLVLVAISAPSVLIAQQQSVPINSDYERAKPTVLAPLPPTLLHELIAIRDAGLNDDYAHQQVAHITENIGPRPVGSPQAQTAVEYVAAELRKLGLEVRLEPVRARRWTRGAETAELVEYPGQAPGTTQKI